MSFRHGLVRGCALVALSTAPLVVAAQVPGVEALMNQGRYWQSKGRQDRAIQAFRQVLALDPQNAEARRLLAGPPPPPAAPTPTPPAAAVPAPPQPVPVAAPAGRPEPRSRPSAPASGAARAAGFLALNSGDLAAAEREFARAIAQNRRDADAMGGLGVVRLRQSRFAEARELLGQASQLGTPAQWAEAFASARFFAGLEAARSALAQGNAAEAQSQAETLVRSNYSDRRPALELLAEIYERQERYADAADLYRQSEEGVAENDGRLRSRVARLNALDAVSRGDYAGADREFQSGLLTDQSDPWIRYEYARYLRDRGRIPEAELLLTTLSLASDPDWLYAAALSNAALKRNAAAEALIARIPDGKRTPQMRSFAINLKLDLAIDRAKALAGEGRQAEALAALRRLGDTSGIQPAKQVAIADALLDLGDSAGASSLAQRALSGGVTSLADYEPIVRVLAKVGLDSLAATAVERAARLADSSADGAASVGRMRAVLAAAQADRMRVAGQYAAAFDLLQANWSDAPGNQEVLGALARLYQTGGLPGQSAQVFQMILTQSPKDKGAWIGLIDTAASANDGALARQAVDRALILFADDPDVYLAAARMAQSRGDAGAALKYLKRAEQLYALKSSVAGVSQANPFATRQGGNPFRNAEPTVQPAPNPFALGGGTRARALPAVGGIPAAPAPSLAAVGAFQPVAGSPVLAPGLAQGARDDAPIGDPVLARLHADIAALSRDSGPQSEFKAEYRQRSGETGLSAMRTVDGSFEASTGFAGGRLSARADAVVADSGRPTQSALARFGSNATAEAVGIVSQKPSQLVQADTQHASGIAVSAAYQNPFVEARVGTTPLGFDETKLTWYGALTPRFSSSVSGRAWIERRPVKDSVLAYAGTRDPVTGARWGQVTRTGAGASLSYDQNGSGLYGDFTYGRYRGLNVVDNSGVEANVGGYTRLYRSGHTTVTAGANVNYQRFANNQNYFTDGHGGYFSPQTFIALGFPFHYSLDSDRLEVRLNATPGYQSFSQDRAPIYPLDPVAQATLDQLKAQNSDVRSYYDSLSKTGLAGSADGSIYYRLNPQTRVGGEFGISTFGNYDEFRSLVGIKYLLQTGK